MPELAEAKSKPHGAPFYGTGLVELKTRFVLQVHPAGIVFICVVNFVEISSSNSCVE